MTAQPTYIGVPCKAHGHTLRYTRSGACALCAPLLAKQWRINNPTKNAEYKRRHYAKNRDKIVKAAAAWRALNPDKAKAQNARLYGRNVAADKAARDDHRGVCAICGTSSPGGKGWHVDHVHDGSGDVRGILCHPCNVGIGMLKDSADLLDVAAAYLRRAPKYKAA